MARLGALVSQSNSSLYLSFVPGVRRTSSGSANLVGVDLAHHAKRFADVLEANEVLVFGYPVSLGTSTLPQLDYAKPLLRTGIVAAKNDALRTIIIDCPVYPGNSGGLVLELEPDGMATHFSAIGVVIEFVPAEERWVNRPYGYENLAISNSGYAVVVPVDAIDEAIASF